MNGSLKRSDSKDPIRVAVIMQRSRKNEEKEEEDTVSDKRTPLTDTESSRLYQTAFKKLTKTSTAT